MTVLSNSVPEKLNVLHKNSGTKMKSNVKSSSQLFGIERLFSAYKLLGDKRNSFDLKQCRKSCNFILSQELQLIKYRKNKYIFS